MLDDFCLVLSGPIGHPDPSKVLCALKQKTGQTATLQEINGFYPSVKFGQVRLLPNVSATNTAAATLMFSQPTYMEHMQGRLTPGIFGGPSAYLRRKK